MNNVSWSKKSSKEPIVKKEIVVNNTEAIKKLKSSILLKVNSLEKALNSLYSMEYKKENYDSIIHLEFLKKSMK